MNSVNLIKTFRYVISDDSSMRTLFEESTQTEMLKRMLFKDAIYASSNENGTQWFEYPHMTFKIEDDEPIIRGCDDNNVFLEITIVNRFGKNYSATSILNIKDRLKELLEDKHEVLNAKALTFSPPIILKVRDIAWVSAIMYDDKEQGTERLHKCICNLKLIVGD